VRPCVPRSGRSTAEIDPERYRLLFGRELARDFGGLLRLLRWIGFARRNGAGWRLTEREAGLAERGLKSASSGRLSMMVDPVRTPPAGFDDLPVEEQIDYVQALWDRIAAHPDRVPVPEWHLEELRRRENAYRTAPDKASTWEEVRERILRRRDHGT
jgi:putative addiction module component (TIGR02574 family)